MHNQLRYYPGMLLQQLLLALTNTVTANSTHPLFLALGIEFYQEVNGQMYQLKNGAYQPFSIG